MVVFGLGELDMVTSLAEENAVMGELRVFKVIEKDSEGEILEEEGWRIVPEDETLLYDDDFLNQFLVSPDMMDQYMSDQLAFVESNDMHDTQQL